MTIKEVEQIVGITTKNIRFYERMGLVSPERNRENSYRNYCESDIDSLKKIKLLRSLYVPIEEIRFVLNGKNDLKDCIARHATQLEHQIKSLQCASFLCSEIEKNAASEIDTDRFLSKIGEYEKEGVQFMNLKKNDTRKKMVAPIICAVVMIALALSFAGIFIWAMGQEDHPPLILAIIFIAIPLCIAFGIIVALVQRYKEIKGGELDEARKY